MYNDYYRDRSMSFVVNTNIGAMNAQRSLHASSRELSTAMERLSTGVKINSAADDAAGFAIAERMTTQVRGLNTAVKLANDGLAMTSIVENATNDVTDILQRMRELAIQASNGTNSESDRAFLQTELNSLTHEIDRIAASTKYNNFSVLDGSFSGHIQVGVNSGQTISYDIASVTISSLISEAEIATAGPSTALKSAMTSPSSIGEIPTSLQSFSQTGWVVNSNSGNASITVQGNAFSELQGKGGLQENATLTIGGQSFTVSNVIQEGSTYTFDLDGDLSADQINVGSGTLWGTIDGSGDYSLYDTDWYETGLQPSDGNSDYEIDFYNHTAPAWVSNIAEGSVLQLQSDTRGSGQAQVVEFYHYEEDGDTYIYLDALDDSTMSILNDHYDMDSVFNLGGPDPDTLAPTSISMEAPVWGSITTQRGDKIWGENNDRLLSRDLSLDGNTLVIGTKDANGRAGEVFVLDWDGSQWQQRGSAIQGQESERFGYSVSISDDGNSFAASSSQGTGTKVFDWDGAQWQQRGNTVEGQNSNERFGHRIALSADGQSFVASAPYAGDNDNGEVRVYDWTGSSWSQRGVSIAGISDYDNLGHRVSLANNGDTLAVSVPYSDDYSNGDMMENIGHAAVYDWNGNNWAQRGNSVQGEDNWENFGKSLALSADGSTMIVGSHYGSLEGSAPYSGYVKVLDWDGDSWAQRGAGLAGTNRNEYFGMDADISDDGNRIAVGAQEDDGSGKVTLYEWNNGSWRQIESIDSEGTADSSYVNAWRVSLSGDGSTLAIGAHSDSMEDDDSDDRGSVTIYDIGGTASGTASNNGDETSEALTNSSASNAIANTNTASQEGNPSQGARFANLDLINGASGAITTISVAIDKVSAQKAELGALQNRLQYTVSNLMNVAEHTAAARSRIQDADFAVETARLAKSQVLQQTGIAMLAQANAAPQLALQLIR